MEGGEGPGRGAHSTGDGEAEGTAMGAATRGGGNGAEEKEAGRDEKLTIFFEVFSYIEPTFSTGWSHQPVLKGVCCQARGAKV